ncbi:uncharacterized protein LOC129945007 [Eupeodes corollae]|uniref:uncharacterized protein LOC129945007 n=1 Tax=Eupeodes corollae TaxID=290404 RepID=UPI00248FAFF7|nr:uncharacterized protein LOC129945007 [Eupeodes corollae]
MGCGQSKIHLYPRKSKSKANGKKSGHVDTDTDADEEEGHVEEGESELNRDRNDRTEDLLDQGDDVRDSSDQPNGEISVSLLRAKNLSLLQSQEISSSQQNFFRMLDKKIDEGPDYDSASETEIALEEARLNALVQHWESASLTASMCSSASRSLQTTPVRQVPTRQPPPLVRTLVQNSMPQQPLSADLLPHGATAPQQGLVMVGPPPNVIAQQQVQPGMPPNQQLNQIIGIGGIVMAGVPQSQSQMMAKVNLSPKRVDPRAMMQLNQNALQQAYAIPPSPQQAAMSTGRPPRSPQVSVGPSPVGGLATHMHMAYYGQPQPTQSTYFGEVLHPMQVPQAPPEYRFPPAISVQRLAPQVQRQLRETQELIKDSCPQLYAAGYGSPGPPMRSQPRNAARRPTLETQFSQELS